MECPKCGMEIDKNTLVCPNCKKVLKIICPVCKTINEKNICKRCGEILVTKCSKCGKINLMKNKKCLKCGYSLEQSALENESNVESFAVVRIDFPNIDVIRGVFGSELYSKFKKNLDNLVLTSIQGLGVRRQIVKNNIYILRFNSAYTFSSSAQYAMNAIIEMANAITRLNVKLISRKDIALKANFSIFKRDADKDPYDIDSGFLANMVSQEDAKSKRALDSCQIITDETFLEYYSEKYKMESLNSVLVDGEMKRFYQVDITPQIKIDDYMKEDKIENEDEKIEVPTFVKNAMSVQEALTLQNSMSEIEQYGNDLYSMDLIDFDEINCAFFKTENNLVFDNIAEILQEVPKGIIALKGEEIYQPNTLKLLATVDQTGVYQYIIPVTCYDEMKYTPYGFFRDLIMSVFSFATSQKLYDKNDYSIFSSIGAEDMVKDLLTLTKRAVYEDLETLKNRYFETFLSMLQAIPDTLIYIENFDKIDSASLDIMERLFANFEALNVSYMISYNKNYSLHKRMHFLLSRREYTEIALIPSSINNIITSNLEFYKNLASDFYFKRILKYSKGSTLYLDHALQYLVELGIYEYTEDSIEVLNPKTTIIPGDFTQLIQRKLNLLKDETELLHFLAMCLLLSSRIDINTADLLGFENWNQLAEQLAQRGYLYFYNDCIYFSNYDILLKALMEILTPEEFSEIATSLLQKAFVEGMTSPRKAILYEHIENFHQDAIYEWEKIANASLSMGDFAAYANCSSNIIKTLEEHSSDWPEENLNEFRNSIYDNIANNMPDFRPDETREIADKTLENLIKTENKKTFEEFSLKMIQGAMLSGEYSYAINLIHKVLRQSEDQSINPLEYNFSLNLLLMTLIHIKALFNIGAYKDCIDIGYNVLNVLDTSRINSIQFNDDILTKEDFVNIIIEFIAYMAMACVFTLNNVQELLDITNKLFDFVPQEYSIFFELEKLIHGQDILMSEVVKGENLFSNLLYYIISAFTQYKQEPDAFAKEIYKAKILAKDSYMPTFEVFADLLIGYSYAQKESYIKAEAIIKEIIKSSKEKGMTQITQIANIIQECTLIKQFKYDIAYNMINNLNSKIERMGSGNEYLLLLNKINMYTVLKARNQEEKANICQGQIQQIMYKYKINLNFGA